MSPIPVNVPVLEGNEAKYVLQAVETGWISSEGPFVKEFESKFAHRHGRKHGIAVCNGTAALQVAVDTLELEPEDEVIVPTFTIIACVNAVIRAGAKPVLVDCDPETFNSTPEQIESAITDNTKAIMLVHIYGLPVDSDPILEMAKKRGIKIIEDAAEVIGLDYKDRPCGSLGDLSTVSFYPNKHVTTGEGGMVLTDDDALADQCRLLRDHCFQTKKRFYHERIGWNYRMTNLQAAIGLAQLERLDEFVVMKRAMGQSYTTHLNECSNLQLPIAETPYAKNIYWVYGVVLKDEFPLDAASVMAKLGEHKIGSRPFFYPMHKQPIFNKMGYFKNDVHPNSERLAERGFYVPGGLALTEEEISTVSEKLIEIANT
jgi:perosamine synthetase